MQRYFIPSAIIYLGDYVGFGTLLFEPFSTYRKRANTKPAIDRMAVEREIMASLYAPPRKTKPVSYTPEQIDLMRRAEMDARLHVYGYDALHGLPPSDQERYATRLQQIINEDRNRPRPNILVRAFYRICDFL